MGDKTIDEVEPFNLEAPTSESTQINHDQATSSHEDEDDQKTPVQLHPSTRSTRAPFKNKFSTVMFAILGGSTVRTFEDVFEGLEGVEIDEDGEGSDVEGMRDLADEKSGQSSAPLDPREQDGKEDTDNLSEVPYQKVVDETTQTEGDPVPTTGLIPEALPAPSPAPQL